MMPRLGRVSSPLLSLVFAAASLGCSSDGPPPPAPQQQAGKAVDPQPGARGTEEAIGRVVKTYNDVIGEVDRSIVSVYFSRVGERVPPVDKLGGIRLGPLAGPWDKLLADAKTNLAAARKAKPDLAMIADAEAMVARAGELGEIYRSVGRYYSASTFSDDKGAGAADLHGQLTRAVSAFHQAQRKVADALEANEQQQLRAEMESHPDTSMSHQFRKALLAAKVLLSARRAENLPTSFAAANETFQEAAKALGAFVATKPDAPLAFKNFHNSFANTFAPHAAKLARELNDPKAHHAQVEADLGLLGSYYNNLVQVTNSLLQAEAAGALN
jgi:hypothetical protein